MHFIRSPDEAEILRNILIKVLTHQLRKGDKHDYKRNDY